MDDSEYPSFDGVEPYGTSRDVDAERAHRKRMCALGYRIFAAMRWGQLGDGHVSARDPEQPDHFWLLDWGVPFGEATVDRLVLVGPGDGIEAVNTAGYNIHAPVLAARPDAVSAAHTHTQFGTPWSANVEPFRAISQESCAFVFDQAMFDDEEVEVLSIDGGKRIAAAIGEHKLCILRNHGLLTVGQTVESAVGWFVMAERVAEVHVKAPNGRAISDEAARIAASTLSPEHTGWRIFQWLQRSVVPDPTVVD
ncbi:MAG: class II aldolase/adducin family protein [Ilumatobacter sp.]|jgi:ribulose-5-phosphate 4-epimerase/fuculose-1-phosphate aldolase|uniref:class II aldolase/adducin family protein n=1 Tax=Ilumatobacter sp. TaxID=1967498 RepID=UPI00391C342D